MGLFWCWEGWRQGGGAIAQSPAREAALAWASLAQRFQLLAFSPGKDLEALVKNLFSYLFQIQASTHIPCPVAPSSIFQASSIASSNLSPLTLLLPPATYKDACEYTE